MAPKLNLSGLTDIRVRAGMPFNLEVPFEGEPQPTVTWKRDDATLKSEDRTDIEVRENFSGLHVMRSERGDTGVYSITLKNEFGEDKGSCKVTVLGNLL